MRAAARRILSSPVYRRRWAGVIGGIVLFAAIVYLSGRIWWVGDHYCFGEMVSCYFPGEVNK